MCVRGACTCADSGGGKGKGKKEKFAGRAIIGAEVFWQGECSCSFFVTERQKKGTKKGRKEGRREGRRGGSKQGRKKRNRRSTFQCNLCLPHVLFCYLMCFLKSSSLDKRQNQVSFLSREKKRKGQWMKK
mmetsp:Transcript_52038/g.101914  ORF Transcript_52038/g.101914 Transcript_52038/m.101914 type:complete len:130 (-) Transcript_52038:753-1142(-)